MNGCLAFFAQVTGDEVLDQWRSLSATTRDGLIIGGALTVVVATAVMWAVYVRKPRRRQHSQHRSSRRPAAASSNSGEGAEPSPRRRKWRRPRREHRPRNPTLAETGGLPPVRNDAPPPDSPY